MIRTLLSRIKSDYITHTNVPHANSFNLIRLIAASMVVFSHSFAITGHPEPHLGSVNLGAVGVWVFFILSGYLISASWHQYPRFNVFMYKRALRIFPAFAVMLLVTALFGVFFTTLPAKEYLASSSVISYFNNIFLYQIQFSLPGVFTDNPYPNVVNGSIWTLSYEFTMYLMIAIIGATRFYKKISMKHLWVMLFVAMLLFSITMRQPPEFILFYTSLRSILPLMLMFFTGVVVQEYFSLNKTKPWLGVASLALFIGCSILLPSLSAVFAATFLAYAIFALGSLPYAAWLQKYGDYSYGIYIYAFPVQQAIQSLTGTQSTLKIFLSSLLVSAALGAASWFFVEKPALQFKKKLRTDRYPVTQVDEAW